jgi:hypothetical protein
LRLQRGKQRLHVIGCVRLDVSHPTPGDEWLIIRDDVLDVFVRVSKIGRAHPTVPAGVIDSPFEGQVTDKKIRVGEQK